VASDEVTASQVGYTRDEDIDVEAVVFAFGNDETLEIQGNLQADEPYCISSNHRGASYSGVEYWSITGTRFTLGLTASTAEDLEYPRELVVEAEAGSLASVRSHIEAILGIAPTS
jgi:hypothetical protein